MGKERICVNQNGDEGFKSVSAPAPEKNNDIPAGGSPAPPTMNMNAAPMQTTRTKRPRTVMVILAAVVVVVIVSAVLLIGLGGTSNGSSSGEIRNGGYLTYSVKGLESSGQSIAGNLTMTFDNVTTTSYSMKESFSIMGQTVNSSEDMKMVNGQWTASSGDGSANMTTPKLIGQETLQTNFGQKTTNHYSEKYDDYTYEFWQDSGSQLLYQLKFSFSYGTVLTCSLTSTNMM